MVFKWENYYLLGKISVWVCLITLFPIAGTGQISFPACDLHVKQEPRIKTQTRRVNRVQQTDTRYFIDWESPDEAIQSDNQYSITALPILKTAETLTFRNFGFQIPDLSAIYGITVKVEGMSAGEGYIREKIAMLALKNSTVIGENKANLAYNQQEWSRDEETTWYYGGKEDTWDLELISEDINDPSFGFSLQVRNASGKEDVTAFIDHVEIEIHYKEVYRFCDGDCVTFSASKNGDIKAYDWIIPPGFELLSGLETDEIIALGKGVAEYGTYEICVDLTDYADEVFRCCRTFILDECPMPTIGDIVWNDLNADGILDSDEEGLPDVLIEIYDINNALVASAISDAVGAYLITDLFPGSYYIRTYPPEGYVFSNNSGPGFNNVINNANGEGTSDFFTIESEDRLDIDIGLSKTVNIGDLVWEDINGNGINDSEPGLSGITVFIADTSGTSIDSTITDSLGNYLFEGLLPGQYEIFIDADIYEVTLKLGELADTDNNDFNQEGSTGLIDFLEGGIYTFVDAGLYIPASLGDRVWIDKNENGLQDDGEPGFPGLKIFLLNGVERIDSTTTDGQGNFIFDDLPPGAYGLLTDIPFGHIVTGTVEGQSMLDNDFISIQENAIAAVELSSRDNRQDIDLGLIELPGSISGIAWEDFNVDGIFNEDEPFLSMIEVYLLDENNNIIATDTTDEQGEYSFAEVKVGTYSLSFESGIYFFSPIPTEGDRVSVVDMDGNTETIIITPALDVTGINAGYVLPAEIGDYVWLDNNRNGIQDPEESGFSSIEVFLIRDGIKTDSTITDAEGRYSFLRIYPGEYSLELGDVEELVPAPFRSGNDPAADSDLSASYTVGGIVLGFGAVDPSVDMGLMLPGSDIHGRIWNDIVSDGLYDAEEPLLSGLTVNLLDLSGSNIASTMTDNEGNYAFISVPAGTYYIELNDPGRFIITTPNAGDEMLDSDLTGEFSKFSSSELVIESGLIYNSIDGGLREIAMLGGQVWIDTDRDGIRSTEELPEADIDFFLIDASTMDTIDIATSDEAGEYGFMEVPRGDYFIVAESLPYTISTADVGDDDAVDSDFIFIDNVLRTEIISVPPDKKNIDLGFVKLSSVSGVFWNDLNADGIRDEGEPFVLDMTVTLLSSDGSIVSRTSTDDQGVYAFDDLLPGSYRISVDVEGQFKITLKDQGEDDTIDNDIDEDTQASAFFTMPDDDGLSIDIGVTLRRGDITGVVWNDSNKNGIREDTETLLPDVVVQLFTVSNILVSTTTTQGGDLAGQYQFIDLPVGIYYIKVLPEEFQFTLSDIGEEDRDSDITEDNGPGTSTIFVLNDGGVSNLDAGLIPSVGIIAGIVWEDLDEDGLLENGENRLENVTLVLYNDQDQEISSTTSMEDGSYSFNDVPIGDYYVALEIEGYSPTLSDQGSNEEIDSDITEEQGLLTTSIFILTTDGVGGLNAGLIRLSGFISGIAWEDSNEDGIFSSSENNLGGVVVELYNDQDELIASTETSESTADLGKYLFTDIPTGNYYVKFIESMFDFTTPNVGDDTSDSDVTEDNGDGTTATFMLTESGVQDLSAGLIRKTAAISGVIWNDFDEDGIRSDGEVGVGEVTVELYDADGNLQSSQELSGGENGNISYLFEDVPLGVYYVIFVAPGYNFTISDQGLDTDDSDVTGANGVGSTDRFTLEEGGIQNLDAGLIEIESAVSGIVWEDENEDGIRQPSERGIDGMIVKLFNSEDVEIASTDSGSNGERGAYFFNNLPLGDYYVQFLTQDYNFTIPDIGDDTTDSDVTESNGQGTTDIFTLDDAGVSTIDAGLIKKKADISGVVWIDENADGIRQDEPGLSVVVNLYTAAGNLVDMTTSSSDGVYLFEDISVGPYYVEFIVEDLEFTTADAGDDTLDSDVTNDNGAGTTAVFILSEGGVENIDAGVLEEDVMTFSISGIVWEDSDEDGIRQATENGIAGINVKLFNEAGVEQEETTTDNDGMYIFPAYANGNYYIEFIFDTENYTLSQADQGSDDTIDSDVTDGNGAFTTDLITIMDTDVTSIDAGLIPEQTSFLISGIVWEDVFMNDINDPGEGLIDGIVVELFLLDGTLLATTSTADINGISGSYQFENLDPGDYYVRFNIGEFIFVLSNVGDDDTTDSDVTDANGAGTTDVISIVSSNISNVDAGIKSDNLTQDVRGQVWIDEDEDGIFSSGEALLNGVMVTLKDDLGNVVGTTVTMDIDGTQGQYLFSDVATGSYFIEYSFNPSLYTITQLDAGNDDTIDSDGANVDGGIITTNGFNIPDADTDHIDLGLISIQTGGSISGIVWEDLNFNGIRGGSEVGVMEFSISLFTSTGVEIDEIETEEDGTYLFDMLDPGDYYLVFAANGFQVSPPNQGGDDAIDSDVTGENGLFSTDIITVLSDAITDIDCGVKTPDTGDGSIAGVAWEDFNGDGIRMGEDSLIAGAIVNLYRSGGTLFLSTSTDSEGRYEFTNLPIGSYYVEIDPPLDDYIATLPFIGTTSTNSDLGENNGPLTTNSINIISGRSIVNFDLGILRLGSIGDRVWYDINRNGIQDPSEAGLNGVTVNLYDAEDQLIDTQVTMDDDQGDAGNYGFGSLSPGAYYIEIILPANSAFTIADNGDEEIDSDITGNNGNGTSSDILISSGMVMDDQDAGIIFNEISVGDYVWLDVNGDNMQNDFESGINGIEIGLFTADGVLVATTTTTSFNGNDGYYIFPDLISGDYYIVVDPGNGFGLVFPDVGDDDLDSDITDGVVSGSSDIFNVDGPVTNIDVGLFIPATIGDFVWEDINEDGIQDPDEPGIGSIRIQLFDLDGMMLQETSSASDGSYVFEGISEGLYYLTFDLPGGNFQFTERKVGDDDAVDSDVDETGTTAIISVVAGVDFVDIDAGIHVSGSGAGGIVWEDSDENGLRNVERPLEGVRVTLHTVNDAQIAETFTKISGRYYFPDLDEDDYYITIHAPEGYKYALQFQGADSSVDSDIDNDGKSQLFKIKDGGDIIAVDGGLIPDPSENVIENINRLQVEVLPNLVIGQASVSNNLDLSMQIYVYNLSGKLVFSTSSIYQNGSTIDLSDLDDGYYFIKIKTEKGTASTQIVKVR